MSFDPFDLPEPTRCACGAVEPFSGDPVFALCLDCAAPVCPTCLDHGLSCPRCQADHAIGYEPREETGQESVSQREIRVLEASGGQRR